jgi:hypothetical protein
VTALALAAVVIVLLWAVLVVVAHVLNPDQSPLSMGMSGLARGRAPWVMKASFIARGLSALCLVAALPTVLGSGALALIGLVLFWVWGGGSAALALADTDLPGEQPTRAGAAHALIALVAYVAGAAGAVALSLALRGEAATAGVARWALPIALAAAVALITQFVAFGSAAREARSAEAAPAGDRTGDAAGDPTLAPAAAPAAASAAGVPPQLTGVSDAGRRKHAPVSAASVSRGLTGYAGLLQLVFVGLLMLWTLLVALGT